MTTQDKDNIGKLFILPEFASLRKLLDNLSIDLQNKSFKDAQKFEELLAVKWVLQYNSILKAQVKFEYDRVIKRPIKDTQNLMRDMESLPDNIPL